MSFLSPLGRGVGVALSELLELPLCLEDKGQNGEGGRVYTQG